VEAFGSGINAGSTQPVPQLAESEQ
jgi:hypothetical protein